MSDWDWDALEGPQAEKVNKALLAVFRTEHELRRFVMFKLTVRLDEVSSGNLSNRVFELVQWTQPRRRTKELCLAALNEFPHHSQLSQLPLGGAAPAANLPATPTNGAVNIQSGGIHIYGGNVTFKADGDIVGGDVYKGAAAAGERVELSSIGHTSWIARESLLAFFVALEDVPEDFEWREAFQQARPAASVAIDIPDHYSERAALYTVADTLAKMPEYEGSYPLYKFARELNLLADEDSALSRSLTTWLAAALSVQYGDDADAARERLETGVASPPGAAALDAPAKHPRIVIQIETEDEAEDDTFHNCQAWYLDFRSTPARLTKKIALSEFSSFLDTVWQQVKGQVVADKIDVELFVPKQLYAWAADRERVKINPIPTIASKGFRSIVLRAECRAPGRLYHPNLKERWGQTSAGACSIADFETLAADDENRFVALNGNLQGDPIAALNDRLMARRGVVGGILSPAPRLSTDEADPDVFDALIWNGVPAILWLRENAPDDAAAEIKQTVELSDLVHEKNFGLLAVEVQQQRSQAVDPWHRGQHLAILLDDPHRPLPSTGSHARLRSPH